MQRDIPICHLIACILHSCNTLRGVIYLERPQEWRGHSRSVVEAERGRVVDVVGQVEEVHRHHHTGPTAERLQVQFRIDINYSFFFWPGLTWREDWLV